MGGYFLRRLLLLPPTLLGITILVFMITRLVPGGPLERAIMEAQAASMSSGTTSSVGQGMALSEDQRQVFQAGDGLANEASAAHRLVSCAHFTSALMKSATARTALTMLT